MNCGYENTLREADSRCDSSCMSGIMVLVGSIGGILFAAAGVLLFVFSLITDPFAAVLTFLIAALVLGAIILIAAFSADRCSRTKCCVRSNLGGLFFGILGTILSASLAISATLTEVSVIAGILLGLSFFFFAYMIISVVFLVNCLVR